MSERIAVEQVHGGPTNEGGILSMHRLGAICGVSAILALSLASPAVATPPEHGTLTIPDEGTDPAGTTCTFAVHFSQVERLDFRQFFDGDGNFLKAIVHIDYD